jgi:hypothetical protein
LATARALDVDKFRQRFSQHQFTADVQALLK